MCQHHQGQHGSPRTKSSSNNEDFPWHIAIHDAHCHPTDTMASVACLPSMRAATLAIMATRSQDQHLVAEVATSHGAPNEGGGCKVVPSFGWHPWFSYQLYDDSSPESTYKPAEGGDSDDLARKAHYQAVLSPSPQDPDFLSSLPAPTPISSFIASTRQQLEAFPYALVGEIGLDKAFRLPQQWNTSDAPARDDSLTPGGREGRLLSPYRVRMQHQQAIMKAQLQLAGEVGRAVSVHGVQAHGVLYDTVSACWKGHERKVVSRRERRLVAPGAEDSSDEGSDDDDSNEEELASRKKVVGGKPFPPRICLHSYSGGVEMLSRWLHPSVPSKVYVSFSMAVNLGTDGGKGRLADVIRAVPDDRILVESDLHIAGEDMEAALEDMYRLVCEIKGWDLENGARRIGKNFNQFIYG